MQFARRSLSTFLFVLCFSIATLAQTAATATITVQGTPEENSIIVLGAPGSPVTFELAHRDPENGNHWIDLSVPPEQAAKELTFEEVAQRIAAALDSLSIDTDIGARWNNTRTVFLEVNTVGAVGNDYSLFTDAAELCIGGFCGGSD